METGSKKPWYENDAFWATFGPFMFNDKRWQATPGEVDQVLALLNLNPGAAVLDVGCGPGRHVLELARRGYRVTGVDRTGAYLDQARTKAAAENQTAEFVQADMREFRRPEAFDAVINMFTAFGYFDDPEDDRRVARNMAASVKPGGKLLMEMHGKEILARRFFPRDWTEENGDYLLENRRITCDWSRRDNTWTPFRGTERIVCDVSTRLYSAVELKDLMIDAGFTSATAYGDLAGAPYDVDAKRLVVVACKGN